MDAPADMPETQSFHPPRPVKSLPVRVLWEARQLLLLGAPILITQLAQTGMGFVDTVMAGRYGENDLAAVAIGSSLWIPLFLAVAGILMALTPMVSQSAGAARFGQIRLALHNGLYLGLALGVLAAWGLRHSSGIFSLMGVEPTVLAITREYVEGLSWGLPAVALYQALRSCNEGLQKTQSIMYVSFLGLACNIPLNYVLIYGKAGFPELGGAGCGYATAIVMWLQMLALAFTSYRSRTFRALGAWQPFERPRLAEIGEILKLGVPIGVSIFIEASMFSLIALFLAPLGAEVVSGHQVTISFTTMVFMFPLSLSIAITIRVGYSIGLERPDQARLIAATGIGITLLFAAFTSSMMLLFAPQIAALYTDSLAVRAIAVSLIGLAAVFQFSDALQISSAGALRGYKDTRVPLLVVFVAYWIVGLPLGVLLGRTDLLLPALGPEGLWIGLIAGLSTAALLLVWRLHSLSRYYLRLQAAMDRTL